MSDTLLKPDPAPTPAPAPPPVAVDPAGDPAPSSGADPAGKPADDPAAWRAALAGDDADFAKELERYADPKAYAKAFKDTQTALRNRTEGMIKLPGADASDEDKQAFAKALGIPDSHDKYARVKPPEGLELADADKAFIDSKLKALHEAGGFAAHPEVVKMFEGFYYEAMQESAAQMRAAAELKRAETKKALEKDWGPDFKVNMGLAEEALRTFGGKEAEGLLEMQFADGTLLGDHPAIIKLLTNAARSSTEDIGFLKTLVTQPSVGAEALQSEYDQIKKWRTGTDSEKARYAEASKPGGRMEQVMEMLNRASARA